jgi:hypothetical protein
MAASTAGTEISTAVTEVLKEAVAMEVSTAVTAP